MASVDEIVPQRGFRKTGDRADRIEGEKRDRIPVSRKKQPFQIGPMNIDRRVRP